MEMHDDIMKVGEECFVGESRWSRAKLSEPSLMFKNGPKRLSTLSLHVRKRRSRQKKLAHFISPLPCFLKRSNSPDYRYFYQKPLFVKKSLTIYINVDIKELDS